MKEVATFKSLAEDIPVRVIDPNSETIRELCAATGLGKDAIYKIAIQKCESGQWEKVWKHCGSKFVPSYRRVKK